MHPGITESIAEFVLKEAGDEFCNILYDEECVIKEFTHERRKMGKNPALLWKRLQPQVIMSTKKRTLGINEGQIMGIIVTQFRKQLILSFFRLEKCVTSAQLLCLIYIGLVRPVDVSFVLIAIVPDEKDTL